MAAVAPLAMPLPPVYYSHSSNQHNFFRGHWIHRKFNANNFRFECYYGTQDLLAINHTQLIVQGLKTINVHLGFAQSYQWMFRVGNVPYRILGL